MAVEDFIKNHLYFIGSNYYRLVQGTGTVGLLVNTFFLIFNTFGIWKTTLAYYNIPLVPFIIFGILGLVVIYWSAGFILERVGLFKYMQSFLNQENNPEWVEHMALTNKEIDLLEKIAKKLEVEK